MFTINIAKGVKKPIQHKPNRISRLTIAKTVVIDGEFKAQLSLRNDPEYPDYIIIPFTAKSLEPYGKIVVFSLKKQKDGKYIEYHRSLDSATMFPGSTDQYTTVVEGEICTGYVVRYEGKLYFDMKEVHGRGDSTRNVPNIKESEPLFKNHEE